MQNHASFSGEEAPKWVQWEGRKSSERQNPDEFRAQSEARIEVLFDALEKCSDTTGKLQAELYSLLTSVASVSGEDFGEQVRAFEATYAELQDKIARLKQQAESETVKEDEPVTESEQPVEQPIVKTKEKGLFRRGAEAVFTKTVGKAAAQVSYKSLASIFAVKIGTDTLLYGAAKVLEKAGAGVAAKKVGEMSDVYQYAEGSKQIAEIKSAVRELIENISGTASVEFDAKMQQDIFDEKYGAIKEKIDQAYIQPEGKQKLQAKLEAVRATFDQGMKELQQEEKDELAAATETYMVKKVQGMQLVRDSLNSAFAVSGMQVVRVGAMAATKVAERLLRNRDFNKQARAEGAKEVGTVKDFGYALTESLSFLTGKDLKNNKKLNKKERVVSFIKTFGDVFTAAGLVHLAGADVDISTSVNKFVENVQNVNGGAFVHNWMANAERAVGMIAHAPENITNVLGKLWRKAHGGGEASIVAAGKVAVEVPVAPRGENVASAPAQMERTVLPETVRDVRAPKIIHPPLEVSSDELVEPDAVDLVPETEQVDIAPRTTIALAGAEIAVPPVAGHSSFAERTLDFGGKGHGADAKIVFTKDENGPVIIRDIKVAGTDSVLFKEAGLRRGDFAKGDLKDVAKQLQVIKVEKEAIKTLVHMSSEEAPEKAVMIAKLRKAILKAEATVNDLAKEGKKPFDLSEASLKEAESMRVFVSAEDKVAVPLERVEPVPTQAQPENEAPVQAEAVPVAATKPVEAVPTEAPEPEKAAPVTSAAEKHVEHVGHREMPEEEILSNGDNRPFKYKGKNYFVKDITTMVPGGIKPYNVLFDEHGDRVGFVVGKTVHLHQADFPKNFPTHIDVSKNVENVPAEQVSGGGKVEQPSVVEKVSVISQGAEVKNDRVVIAFGDGASASNRVDFQKAIEKAGFGAGSKVTVKVDGGFWGSKCEITVTDGERVFSVDGGSITGNDKVAFQKALKKALAKLAKSEVVPPLETKAEVADLDEVAKIKSGTKVAAEGGGTTTVTTGEVQFAGPGNIMKKFFQKDMDYRYLKGAYTAEGRSEIDGQLKSLVLKYNALRNDSVDVAKQKDFAQALTAFAKKYSTISEDPSRLFGKEIMGMVAMESVSPTPEELTASAVRLTAEPEVKVVGGGAARVEQGLAGADVSDELKPLKPEVSSKVATNVEGGLRSTLELGRVQNGSIIEMEKIAFRSDFNKNNLVAGWSPLKISNYGDNLRGLILPYNDFVEHQNDPSKQKVLAQAIAMFTRKFVADRDPSKIFAPEVLKAVGIIK